MSLAHVFIFHQSWKCWQQNINPKHFATMFELSLSYLHCTSVSNIIRLPLESALNGKVFIFTSYQSVINIILVSRLFVPILIPQSRKYSDTTFETMTWICWVDCNIVKIFECLRSKTGFEPIRRLNIHESLALTTELTNGFSFKSGCILISLWWLVKVNTRSWISFNARVGRFRQYYWKQK